MHPVPVRAVTLGQGFWYDRRKVNVERSMPTMYDLLEANGILDNFAKYLAARMRRSADPSTRIPTLQVDRSRGIHPAIRPQSRPAIEDRSRHRRDHCAQQPDGYLHTHIKDADRFTRMNRDHELYCLGHLLQGAIAYYRATGNRRLLTPVSVTSTTLLTGGRFSPATPNWNSRSSSSTVPLGNKKLLNSPAIF